VYDSVEADNRDVRSLVREARRSAPRFAASRYPTAILALAHPQN